MKSKKIYVGLLVIIMLFISVPVEALENDSQIDTSKEDITIVDDDINIEQDKETTIEEDVLTENSTTDNNSIIYSEPKDSELKENSIPKDNSNIITNDVLNGWSYENGNTYYYVNGEKVHGFYNIAGVTYYFGATSGKLMTGWQEVSEGRFYLYSDGSIKEGWQDIEGNRYYVRDKFVLRGFNDIAGVTYYFGATSGKLMTGWQEVSEGRFYLYSDGSIKEGWQEIEGKTYYVRNNFILRGKQEVDGLEYEFDKQTGVLQEGKQVTSDNKVFFIDEDGNRLYGWQEVDGERYYVADDGFAVHGFQNIAGKTYFFGLTSGKMLTGWQEVSEGRFYLYSDGSIKEGWQDIEGNRYYVRDKFVLRGFNDIAGVTYYFGATSGKMMTGWQNLGNNIFYLGIDGILVYGNQTIEGRNYLFNEDGYLQGFTYGSNGNVLYYHNPDGSQAKGVQRIAGKYYKFDEITGAFECFVNQRIVIDVSYHQGVIDWDAVKNSGMVDAVILRLGYSTDGLDAQFLRNVNELNRLGIPYTVYLFSYAENAYEAGLEADFLINTIKNNPVYISSNIFSIYYDLEDWIISSTGQNSYGISKETYASMITTFANKVKDALGIDVKVYASTNYIETRFPDSVSSYIGWVAQWGPECTYDGTYEGWQYTDAGSVPGISGNVDMSIFYY